MMTKKSQAIIVVPEKKKKEGKADEKKKEGKEEKKTKKLNSPRKAAKGPSVKKKVKSVWGCINPLFGDEEEVDCDDVKNDDEGKEEKKEGKEHDIESKRRLLTAIMPHGGGRGTQNNVVLTKEVLDFARTEVLSILESKNGRRLSHCPISEWNGGKARWDQARDDFIIQLPNVDSVPWEELRRIKMKIPVWRDPEPLPPHAPFSEVMERVQITPANGICKDFYHHVDLLVAIASKSTLAAVLSTLNGLPQEIIMRSIGRDGSGTKGAVQATLPAVFQFLVKVTTLAPEAIYLDKDRVSHFIVANGPLLWEIRDHISQFVYSSSSTCSLLSSSSSSSSSSSLLAIQKQWPILEDNSGMELFECQKSALRKMEMRSSKGRRGHYLRMMMGLGKSFTILKRFIQLSNEGTLPKYIVWIVVSDTDVVTLKDEVAKLRTNFVIHYRKVIKGSPLVLKPFHINVVLMDTIRRDDCFPVLMGAAPDTFVVVDECYKLNSDTTLRQMFGLQYVALAQDFCAATGTILNDHDASKLCPWLNQISPFIVHPGNIYPAMLMMHHESQTTGIKRIVKHLVFDNDWPSDLHVQYLGCVPPIFGGTLRSATHKDFHKASIICDSATARLIARHVRERIQCLKIKDGKINSSTCIISRDTNHQQEILEALLMSDLQLGIQCSAPPVARKDIFMVEDGRNINITAQSVAEGIHHAYKVIICPLSKARSSTYSYFQSYVSGEYACGTSTRDQAMARIDRLGQIATELEYVFISCGINSEIAKRHGNAESLTSAINDLHRSIFAG